MARQYAESLVADIKMKQELMTVDGVEVLLKNIPDSDIKGAMDPRLYRDMRKMTLLFHFIPKKYLQNGY